MRRALVLLTLAALAAPTLAFTIYFKDGSTIQIKERYTVDGENAYFTLENGTESFVRVDEIDVERTEQNNRGALGNTLVLQDGEVVKLEDVRKPEPPRPTLGNLITTGRATASAASRGDEPAPRSTDTGERLHLADAALADRIFLGFRDRGVVDLELRRGERPGHAWLELTTDTEAAVFQGLEAAAAVLSQLTAEGALEGLELHFRTSEHEAAGDFVLTPALAASLAGGEIETPTFYVRHVVF